jgi:hypothetical protein
VAASQKIAFEPALAKVLAQHLHHAAVGRDMVVDGDCRADKAAVFDLEDAIELVRVGLVGIEQTEVLLRCDLGAQRHIQPSGRIDVRSNAHRCALQMRTAAH